MDLQLSRRPLCLFLFVFLISLFLCGLFFSPLKLLFAALILFILLILRFIIHKNSIYTFICIILIPVTFSLVFSYFAFDLSGYKKANDLSGKCNSAEAVIIEKVSDYDYATSYTAYLRYADGERANIRIRLTTSFSSDYETGDCLLINNVQIKPSFSSLSLEDGYDFSKGILCRAECGDESSLTLIKSGEAVFPYTHTASLRAFLSKTLARYLEGEGLAVSKALVYGDRSSLANDLKNSFAALGISHALAISGLHLGILMGFMTLILSLFRVRKPVRLIFVLLVGLFYAFIAGLSPSICRAYLMYAIYILSEFSRRKKDPPTTLVSAVSIICLLSPGSVFDIGLHLSFFSTLGILTVGTKVIKSINQAVPYRSARYVLSVCVISVFASLFTLPYSIYYFGYISLISPVSNLIFIPIITLIVYIAPFIIIFSFAPFIASAVAALARPLCIIIVFLCRTSYSFSDSFLLSFESDFARVLGVFAIVSIILCLLFLKRKHLSLIPFALYLASVMCVYLVSFFISYNNAEILYLSDGRSEAFAFVSGNRATLVENSYSSYTFLSGAIDAAEEDGVTRVSCLVITHFHDGTLSAVSRIIDDYPHIESIVVFSEDEDMIYAAKRSASKAGISFSSLGYGDILTSDSFSLTVSRKVTSSHPPLSIYFEGYGTSFLCSAEESACEISVTPLHGTSFESFGEIKKTLLYKEKLQSKNTKLR